MNPTTLILSQEDTCALYVDSHLVRSLVLRVISGLTVGRIIHTKFIEIIEVVMLEHE